MSKLTLLETTITHLSKLPSGSGVSTLPSDQWIFDVEFKPSLYLEVFDAWDIKSRWDTVPWKKSIFTHIYAYIFNHLTTTDKHKQSDKIWHIFMVFIQYSM